jgi:hypothetical protein
MKNLLNKQTNGNESDIEANANPIITETELTEKIFNEIPLGLHKEKFDKDLAKYFTKFKNELKIEDSVIPDLKEIITTKYEDLHYDSMAEMFVRYGLIAETIKSLKTIKENIFNFPQHICL